MRFLLLTFAVAAFFLVTGHALAEDKPDAKHDAKHGDGKDAHAHAAKYKVDLKLNDKHEVGRPYDLTNEEHEKELMKALKAGAVDSLHVDHTPNPMDLSWDLGLWSIVIFILLLFILRKAAWGPMLEGLQKREETILSSVEEAKKARAETERITAEFKAKMDQAYAEIPKMMEEARREGDTLKEEMRTTANKEIQTERQRLRREIDTARDQGLEELRSHAAQLATLMSAKVIGRSLSEEDHRRLLQESIDELGKAGRR